MFRYVRKFVCVWVCLAMSQIAGCMPIQVETSAGSSHQSVSYPSPNTETVSLSPDEEGNVEHVLSFDGMERSYIVHVPPNHALDGRASLVMSLHGRPGVGRKTMESQRWFELADAENFVLVYPQGSEAMWGGKSLTHWNALNMETGVDDVGFLKAVVEAVTREYGTNPNRVYAAGFSNGGMMVSRLVCEAGDTFAALASVAGVGATAHTDCVPDKVTPIAFIHGEKDELPAQEGRISNLRPVQDTLDVFINAYECSPKPRVRELPDIDKEDQTTTTHYVYSGCKHAATVEYFFVRNGGHTWPGSAPAPSLGHTSQDFKATEELWDFFKQYEKD